MTSFANWVSRTEFPGELLSRGADHGRANLLVSRDTVHALSAIFILALRYNARKVPSTVAVTIFACDIRMQSSPRLARLALTMRARLARAERKRSRSVSEKDYSNLELLPYRAPERSEAERTVRPIPRRLIRSARHDPGRAPVYAYVTVNGSPLRGKKTATTNSRRVLFGMLRARRNRHRRHATASSSGAFRPPAASPPVGHPQDSRFSRDGTLFICSFDVLPSSNYSLPLGCGRSRSRRRFPPHLR